MLKFFLIGLFACSDVVLGLAPPIPNPSISSPRYILPQLDPNPSQRAQEVALSRAGFLYGPPLIGNSSFFPTGQLGNQRVRADVDGFIRNAEFINQTITNESNGVIQ